jgi:hypothetical protein
VLTTQEKSPCSAANREMLTREATIAQKLANHCCRPNVYRASPGP